MGKSNSVTAPSVWQEVLQPGLYKRNQGRIARQVTFAAAAIIALLIAWRISQANWVNPANMFAGSNYVIPGIFGLLGLWLSYRLVNISKFADFLIAVEAEMNKVSWPSRTELIRSSVIVIAMILILAGCLYLFDFVWTMLLKGISNFWDMVFG